MIHLSSTTNLRRFGPNVRSIRVGTPPILVGPSTTRAMRTHDQNDFTGRRREFSILHTTSEWRPDLAQSSRRFPLPIPVNQFLRQRPHQEQLLQHQHNRFVDTEQVRFRRHDRSSAFVKPRPKTKKQRQDYNRRMKKQADEAALHSPPGSKAGPRRQWAKDRWQQLLDYGKRGDSTALVDPTVSEQYTMEDALLEDIIGNTSHLTSQPTPQPVYLGHRHKAFYNKVADQMDAYREAIDRGAIGATQTLSSSSSYSSSSSALSTESSVDLPSDKDISKVLRAYRDRHGTRNKPIGIVPALRHILQDLGVPTLAFGEYTYTSLLTCCRTPQEARRIFKLMTQNNHAISAYSWSILVDVHAKVGDFEGCSQVIKEMTSHGGHAPTQAAYTSLLAACYRVCSDGRIPHAIRAEAGKVGWTHWQQMRIVGIEPDAMAYGAIIRLCAARGHPERAIGLLEDMQRFDVKPTTLCFSGALKAVAKSHEIAIRFENGSSPKQLKRESNASHHGNMARRIVIMAEAAEVEQDEGFVSALMLCAAAAGDSATAKAIFLASEVRRMDHLRTIGSNENLQYNSDKFGSLVGNSEASTAHITDTESIVPASPSERSFPAVSHQNGQPESVQSFSEREYGKDTRTLSALLHASAQAMNRNGLGTMWVGRENQGYLCENSLRLITTRWEPSYKDTSIPGVSSTKVGIGLLRRVDEEERDEDPKPGKRKKFRGLYIDSDDATTVEDLDDQEIVRSTGEKQNHHTENDFFSSERPKVKKDVPDVVTTSRPSVEEKLLFQDTHTVGDLSKGELFNLFMAEIKIEAERNGEEFHLSETEARELFEMMQEEFSTIVDGGSDDGNGDGVACGRVHTPTTEVDAGKRYEKILSMLEKEDSKSEEELDLSEAEIEKVFQSIREEIEEGGEVQPMSTVHDINQEGVVGFDVGRSTADLDTTFLPASSNIEEGNKLTVESSVSNVAVILEEGLPASGLTSSTDLTPKGFNLKLSKIEELQDALPGMPKGRLAKIVTAFEETLGYPSILKLVPILRETMPNYITPGWLKTTNRRNAEFVLQKASEDGLVDSSLLNAMLEVITNAGPIHDALEFHATEFDKYKLAPSVYSDRLVVQMLVTKHLVTRALRFKESVEASGRYLDIASYGTLVQYFSRHKQLGSALLLLKECMNLHGVAPSATYLSTLRTIYKQQLNEADSSLDDLIGRDPIAWLKHGERHLKREMSQKGRRNVQLAYNRILA